MKWNLCPTGWLCFSNGQYIGSMLTKDTTVTEMTNMMVGHAVTLNIDRPEPVNPKPRIEVEGLTVRNEEGIVKLKDVSFTANSGEILGIAGISGCGQKELLEAIAGLQVIEVRHDQLCGRWMEVRKC